MATITKISSSSESGSPLSQSPPSFSFIRKRFSACRGHGYGGGVKNRNSTWQCSPSPNPQHTNSSCQRNGVFNGGHQLGDNPTMSNNGVYPVGEECYLTARTVCFCTTPPSLEHLQHQQNSHPPIHYTNSCSVHNRFSTCLGVKWRQYEIRCSGNAMHGSHSRSFQLNQE